VYRRLNAPLRFVAFYDLLRAPLPGRRIVPFKLAAKPDSIRLATDVQRCGAAFCGLWSANTSPHWRGKNSGKFWAAKRSMPVRFRAARRQTISGKY
jgi:hypothetical protein